MLYQIPSKKIRGSDDNVAKRLVKNKRKIVITILIFFFQGTPAVNIYIYALRWKRWTIAIQRYFKLIKLIC